MKKFFLVFSFIFMFGTSSAHAMVMITEILADPAPGIAGDADGNGVRSTSGDEFVEIYNTGDVALNLFSWSIADATSTRHVFNAETILMPQAYAVIFGSNASSGALGLNNSGDTISLFDDQNQLVDQVIYGSLASQNQSIVREGSEFVLHTSVAATLFSPGEDHKSTSATVPEPATLLTLGLGSLAFLRKRHLIC